ncbi:hypothetical protein CYMTET_13902, partial [Cymbomonas tetramitiformis]
HARWVSWKGRTVTTASRPPAAEQGTAFGGGGGEGEVQSITGSTALPPRIPRGIRTRNSPLAPAPGVPLGPSSATSPVATVEGRAAVGEGGAGQQASVDGAGSGEGAAQGDPALSSDGCSRRVWRDMSRLLLQHNVELQLDPHILRLRAADSPARRHFQELSGEQTGEVYTHTVPPARPQVSGQLLYGRLPEWPAEVAVLRNDEPVSSVAFGGEGRLLAAGAYDGVIRLWDSALGAGRPQTELHGHASWVTSVAFGADGNTLASGSLDQTLRLWDAATGKPVAQLVILPVTSVALHSSCRLVAFAAKDRIVRFWEPFNTSGKPCQLRGHSAVVTSVALGGLASSHLASGAHDHAVLLWDVATSCKLTTFSGHDDTVTAVALSPDGVTLASACSDHAVWLWDTRSGRAVQEVQGRKQNAAVTSVALRLEGSLVVEVVSGSSDRTVKVWDAVAGRQRDEWRGHTEPITAVAVGGAGGNFVASASTDTTVRLWEMSSGETPALLGPEGRSPDTAQRPHSLSQPHEPACESRQEERVGSPGSLPSPQATGCRRGLSLPPEHTGGVTAVAFCPDGAAIVSGSRDRTARLWEAGGHTLLAGHSGSVSSVAFSADGAMVASGSDDSTVRLWAADSGAQVMSLQGHGRWVSSVAFSSDGTWLASGAYDRTVRLWNLVSTPVASLELAGHAAPVTCVAFSCDGTILASGSDDRTVQLWGVSGEGMGVGVLEPGRPLTVLQGHTKRVTSVAFSADGGTLASASDDGAVQLWDVTSSQPLRALHLPTGASIASLSFGAGATADKLAGGGADHRVWLWSVSSGRCLGCLKGHVGTVTAVAFASSGGMLASGSADKTVRLWDMALEFPRIEAEITGGTDAAATVAPAQAPSSAAAGGASPCAAGDDPSLAAECNPLPPKADPAAPSKLAPRKQSSGTDLLRELGLEWLDSEQRRLVLYSGVSVEFLVEFQTTLEARFPGRQLTTKEVVEEVVKVHTSLQGPGGAAQGVRYIDLLEMRGRTGPPMLFVSHMWSGDFGRLTARVREALAGADLAEAHVWIDIFAINQHGGMAADLDLLQHCLHATTSGTLLVMDEVGGMVPLSRAWCVYEVWSTLHLRGERYLRLHEGSLHAGVWAHVVSSLDLRHCQAFSASDKDTILKAVERTVGVDALNYRVRALFVLEPIFFDEDLAALQPGRATVELASFDTWAAIPPPAGAALWIAGGAGTGKSMVAAAIVQRHRAAQDSAPLGATNAPSHTLLHFFVRCDDLRRRDPVCVVRTLAHQLFMAFPAELGPYYCSLGLETVRQLRDCAEAARVLLREPLQRLPPGRQRVIILVDALDEGLGAMEGAGLAWPQRCWRNRILRLVCRQLRQLPVGVSLVVTSRPTGGPVATPEATCVSGEVPCYVGHMLRGEQAEVVTELPVEQVLSPGAARDALQREMLALAPALEVEQAKRLTMNLQRHGMGSMVYCRVVRELAQGMALCRASEKASRLTTLEVAWDRAGSRDVELVPASLDDAYMRYMRGLEARLGRDWMRRLLGMIEVMAAAREPLSVSQLLRVGFSDAMELLLDAGFLLRVSEEFKVLAFHHSALDFFTDPRRAGDFHADPARGHARLFAAMQAELRAPQDQRPSTICLRNVLVHGRRAGPVAAAQLQELVSSLAFWQQCYEAGLGPDVLHDLLDMVSPPQRAVAHAACSEAPGARNSSAEGTGDPEGWMTVAAGRSGSLAGPSGQRARAEGEVESRGGGKGRASPSAKQNVGMTGQGRPGRKKGNSLERSSSQKKGGGPKAGKGGGPTAGKGGDNSRVSSKPQPQHQASQPSQNAGGYFNTLLNLEEME